MRALAPALLLALPLLAGDRDPLAEAVEAFGSDHPARRDAATKVARAELSARLAPLLAAMQSGDPEVSRRARESIESLLPPRPAPPGGAEEDPNGWGQVLVMNGRQQGRVVLRVVQANGQQLRIVNGQIEEEQFERLKEFGLDGEAATDATLRRQLRLADGRGFLVREVREQTDAARCGLKPHDILLRVDGKPVMKPKDVEGALGEEKERWKDRRFRVLRDGELLDLPGDPPRGDAVPPANGAR